VAALAGTFVMAQDMSGAIKRSDGRAVPFDDIRYKRTTQSLVLTLKGTQNQMEIAITDIADMRMNSQPDGLVDAVKNVRRGVCSESEARVLKKVFEDYEMLYWDVPAGQALAECYVGMNKAEEAEKVCEKLFNRAMPIEITVDMMGIYLDSLIKQNKGSKFDSEVKRLLGVVSRPAAAMIQLKRGEKEYAQRNYKEALISGFLRTVVLFQDVKEVQPQALYYAALCFKQLGEVTYSERMRGMLVENYGNDPLVQKLNSEL